MKFTTKLWIGLGALAALSPLGLYLPDKFKAGDAWGEWDAEKFKEMVGYIPAGLQKFSSFWKAIMPDYTFRGWENKGLGHLSFAYIVSAVIGIVICVTAAYFLGKLLTKKET